jgi:hypothetical protein
VLGRLPTVLKAFSPYPREGEEHELQFERTYFDGLDRVGRRDKRGEITSSVPSDLYRSRYDLINWKAS